MNSVANLSIKAAVAPPPSTLTWHHIKGHRPVLRKTFHAYHAYCKTYPALAQLVNKRFYGNLKGTDEKTPYALRFQEEDSRIFREMLELYEAGVRDGSVRAMFRAQGGCRSLPNEPLDGRKGE